MTSDFNGIKVIIFDLDGTLIDTKLDIAESVGRILSRYGHSPLPPDTAWNFLGDGATYLMDRCFNHYGAKTPPGAVELFVEDYEKHPVVHTKCYPGVIEALGSLHTFDKAILTNKLHSITMKICDLLDISKYFKMILGRGDYKKKPDPEGIFKILDRFGVPSTSAVIVGDTTIDMEAGKRAGVRRIAVPWGVHERSLLKSAVPDGLIEDMRELKGLLRN